MLVGSSVPDVTAQRWGWKVVVGVADMSWLRMVVDGCGWSWVVTNDRRWMCMDAYGCVWTRIDADRGGD